MQRSEQELRRINARSINTQRIAQKLREARIAAGLSQDGASQLCGIARPLVSRLERGNRLPHLDTIERMATVYGVTVVSILTVEPEPEQSHAAE